MTRKVRFRTDVSTEYRGQNLWFYKDTVADLPQELADRYVAKRIAVLVVADKTECAALSSPTEVATVRRPVRRKRGKGTRNVNPVVT